MDLRALCVIVLVAVLAVSSHAGKNKKGTIINITVSPYQLSLMSTQQPSNVRFALKGELLP